MAFTFGPRLSSVFTNNYAAVSNGSQQIRPPIGWSGFNDNTPFATSFWLKIPVGSATSGFIANIGAPAAIPRIGFTSNVASNFGSYIQVTTSTGISTIRTRDNSHRDGNWHHHLWCYDGTGDLGVFGKWTLYQDGALLAFVGPDSNGSGTSNEILTGGSVLSSNNTGYYIDEFAIFNSNPSAEVIYNGGLPGDLTSLSPLNWWRLENDSIDSGIRAEISILTALSTFTTDIPS